MKEKHNGSGTMLEVMLQRLKTETAWMTKCFFYSAESSQEHADASTHVSCRPQSVDVNRQGGDMRGGGGHVPDGRPRE